MLSEAQLGLNPDKLQSVSRLRKYLRTVVVPAHRRALTQLLCAGHPFTVEQMRRIRWREDGSYIPRDCRPCRYCDETTESEIHVLFECVGLEDLVTRRNLFLNRVDDFLDAMTSEQCLERRSYLPTYLPSYVPECIELAKLSRRMNSPGSSPNTFPRAPLPPCADCDYGVHRISTSEVGSSAGSSFCF